MQSLQHTFAQEGQLPRGMTVYSRFTMHMHYVHYSMLIALYTLPCALCKLQNENCTMHITIVCTLLYVHCTMPITICTCTIHIALVCTLRYAHCMLHIAICTLHHMYYTMHIAPLEVNQK